MYYEDKSIRRRGFCVSSLLKWKIYEKYNYVLRYFRYRRDQLVQKMTGHGYWPLPYFESRHKLMSLRKTNQLIRDAIESGQPFWVGRFGGTEMNMIFEYLKSDMIVGYDNKVDATSKLCELSGFFPNDIELGNQFVRMMLDCCKDINLQAAWGRYMADYVYREYQPSTKLTRLDRIEPWNMYLTLPKRTKSNKEIKDKPWSSALKGKKVLIIHPFVETIWEQYINNRENIFSNIYDSDDILPEFELITLKAVQTLAGEKDSRFSDWFEAFEWMVSEVEKINEKTGFDVAIIGCGAYGYPLAARIKKMGKVAIHLAGATQLLFGITGHRWESEHIYKDFRDNVINEYWVRPDKSEHIKNGSKVEESCYW